MGEGNGTDPPRAGSVCRWLHLVGRRYPRCGVDPIDGELMAKARVLAAGARLRTAPNPWVGCVIVNDGEIVGTGATQPPGGLHAEAQATQAAGARANGATVYVTLEPCAHHGRTPPCADALIAAGVRRVVTTVEDPDPEVRGRGHERLPRSGDRGRGRGRRGRGDPRSRAVPAPASDRARGSASSRPR